MTDDCNDILPDAETYHEEYEFFPWGDTMEQCIAYVCEHTPREGDVLDAMCGTGFLLSEVERRRPDLSLSGFDIREDYVEHARCTSKEASFFTADILDWTPAQSYDIVVCTAGLHHVPFRDQPSLLTTLKNAVGSDGELILADPCVGSFISERERKVKSAELGYEYLRATLSNNPATDIVEAAVDIMRNDVVKDEWKNEVSTIQGWLEERFDSVQKTQVWPSADVEYGDYVFVCQA